MTEVQAIGFSLHRWVVAIVGAVETFLIADWRYCQGGILIIFDLIGWCLMRSLVGFGW
jgi:hypothetical protein